MPVTTRHEALVVGEALVDLTHRAGQPEIARPGGSPLNVAIGLSRLEVSTTLATQIGDDEHGELLRDHLDESDVDVRSLPPHRTHSATALAEIDDGGRATYTFDIEWDPSELPEPATFGLVHVGSIGAALAPGADAVLGLASRTHGLGLPLSFDPNVRTDVTADLVDVRRRFDALVANATMCKLSDEDAEALRPGQSPEATVDELLSLDAGPSLVVVTFGGEGSLIASGSHRVRRPAPTTTLADTIGAGDSFMSALLFGLVERDWLGRDAFDIAELSWLADLAAKATAITCSRHGADPPSRAELDPSETP